jgi:uncharacterized damage-inducible protein DinB
MFRDPPRRSFPDLGAACQDAPVRTEPAPTAGELDLLSQYLDYQRETILLKTDGLTRAQLAHPLPPSGLTLGGLLNHLALVEDDWMEVHFRGRPEREPWASVDWDADRDWEFHTAAEMAPKELRRRYRDACERSREAVAQAAGPDQLSVQPLAEGGHFSLRWVLLHLIEETARHAGHADLLREAIDGTVGE